MTYILLDANVTAGYYLPRSLWSKKARQRIENIFDSARSGQSDFFFYLPNFCVAEVFSVFMKHSFGAWHAHLKNKGTIATRVYKSLVNQWDIHSGKFIYDYELSRYHVLGINLIAPVDHYYRFNRGKNTAAPMGTFDHLILSMGVHLAHIHGRDNVLVVSADSRPTNILKKCCGTLSSPTKKKLKLDLAESLTGRLFAPATFPRGVNLKTAKNAELKSAFGEWLLPVGQMPKVYRWTES